LVKKRTHGNLSGGKDGRIGGSKQFEGKYKNLPGNSSFVTFLKGW